MMLNLANRTCHDLDPSVSALDWEQMAAPKCAPTLRGASLDSYAWQRTFPLPRTALFGPTPLWLRSGGAAQPTP